MVFSSLEFVLLFLPISILGYYFFLNISLRGYALLFILIASFFYYAYWRVENVLIIFVSIVLNYFLGNMLSSTKKCKKYIFIFSVFINLLILFYYKYTIFFLETINSITSSHIPIPQIILPIGISFFTFQQIAYLSDIYTGKYDPTGEGLLNYSLFICFFPQLVAGPIVHHKEMMPQFASAEIGIVNWESILKGLLLFSMGLAKKVLIAEPLSPVVGYIFEQAGSLTFCEALYGSLCYTLQLYFDFSGYCDMAVGCALMLNIQLPWNFDSPYKSTNIQEFWRRWHMTLSRWLRDYLYIPLGGNRKGINRTLVNLFLTFLLGGLWHGAAWTFVIWGVMHGVALIIHRLWAQAGKRLARPLAWLLTFSFINLSWIIFRASDVKSLRRFMDGFAGFNGWLPREKFMEQLLLWTVFPHQVVAYGFTLCVLCICFWGKNSREILQHNKSLKVYLFSMLLCLLSLGYMCFAENSQEFIYFHF